MIYNLRELPANIRWPPTAGLFANRDQDSSVLEPTNVLTGGQRALLVYHSISPGVMVIAARLLSFPSSLRHGADLGLSKHIVVLIFP